MIPSIDTGARERFATAIHPDDLAEVFDRPMNSCKTCVHRSRYGTCVEPVAAGLTTMFCIEWPPEGFGAYCPAWQQRSRMSTASAAKGAA